MMGRRKKYPQINDLEITDIAAEGRAIGRHEGLVVFVPMAVPGDIVDVQIKRKRKNFMDGVIVRYKKYAENRAEPFCEHFGVCGGCTWQQLPYTWQLKFKQKQVSDNISRIAKTELPEMLPILSSDHLVRYAGLPQRK
jgi:23S rRNA (uracil1939-C5)-methyltransferase